MRGARANNALWISFIFLIVVFFAANHDFNYSIKYEQIQAGSAEQLAANVEEGSLQRRVALIALGIFALASFGLVKRPPWPMASGSSRLWALFIVLSFVSILWAEDKNLAFRRATEFFLICLGAFAIVRQCKLRDLLQLAFTATLVYLIVGLACEIALGKFAPLDEGYRFCGTLHPNHQAWNCAFLFFSSIGFAKDAKRWRGFFVMTSLVALAFLILTKSRTSLACLVMALFAYWTLMWPRWRKIAVACSLTGGFCLVLLLAGPDVIPTLGNALLLGRADSNPATLTDRTLMWQASMPYAVARPLLGYGFHSFWTKEHILVVSSELGFPVPATHDDYFDLVLGVGIPGLVLFLIILGHTLARYLRAYRETASADTAIALALLLFCCLTMTTEVIGFSTGLPTFVFYTLLLTNPPLAFVRHRFTWKDRRGSLATNSNRFAQVGYARKAAQ
jgi:O-antigen ligase